MSKRIITINRMYGSGGRVLGKALAEKLGYAFYDKELIELAGKEKQIPFHELAKVDEKKPHQWRFSGDHDVQITPDFYTVPMNDVLYEAQRDIILSLAEKGSCVIVGRLFMHPLISGSEMYRHGPEEKNAAHEKW